MEKQCPGMHIAQWCTENRGLAATATVAWKIFCGKKMLVKLKVVNSPGKTKPFKWKKIERQRKSGWGWEEGESNGSEKESPNHVQLIFHNRTHVIEHKIHSIILCRWWVNRSWAPFTLLLCWITVRCLPLARAQPQPPHTAHWMPLETATVNDACLMYKLLSM